MDDFYKMVETPFDKAVDRAIAEANQAFLDSPEAQRKAQEAGDRWRCIFEAQEAAGAHAVVLPMALAEAILALLRGDTNRLEELSPGLTAHMLDSEIKRAKAPRA